MLARRTVVFGVAAGFACAAGFIVMDAMHPPRAAAKPEVTAAPSASAKPERPLPSAAASATTAASASPAASAPPASGAPSSSPRADGMIHFDGAKYRPTFLTRDVDVKPFSLDVTEVTRGPYQACVDATACAANAWAKAGVAPDPKLPLDLPASDVTWSDAKAYCAWAKKRLPTEIEWEFAARRAATPRLYPWGSEAPAAQLCWRKTEGACPVGATPAGDTPEGLKDMAGNVWEWTADEHFCTNPDAADTCDPYRHVARGGGWNAFSPKVLENTFRNAMNEPASYVGFRCAKDD
jgi:formylglycine-generating enzyme required for sulfatase activity